MPIQRPNAVVDFFVPDFESPSFFKGRILRSDLPEMQTGQSVLARAGGVQRILQIANGRKGHVFIKADLTPNTNETSKNETPWFATMVFDEANMVETSTSFNVLGPDGTMIAAIAILDSGYNHVEAAIQPDGKIHVVITSK